MAAYYGRAKRDMVSFKIDPTTWEEHSQDQDQWRETLRNGVVEHDKAWFALLSFRRELRHQRPALPLSSPGSTFTCQLCCRCCRSNIGLTSHVRKCRCSNMDAV
jgi:hypothetical protein